jgi:quinol monooxygenase YgiN
MLMTIAEAEVVEERWETLRQVFAQAERPAALRTAFLAQESANRMRWRIIGVWASRESFDAYRQSVETPGAMAMFRVAGAEPAVSILDIADHSGM